MPDGVLDYYGKASPVLPRGKSLQADPQPKAPVFLIFSEKETKSLFAFCAQNGCTLHTMVQLVYAKTLMDLKGADELWLIHVDHGRHNEWGNELRIVGNLMTGFPLKLERSMTGAALQEDILMLRQFAGITDSSIFTDLNFRRCTEGIISQDFAPLDPCILSLQMLDPAEVKGNAMKLVDGGLTLTLREPEVCKTAEASARFKEAFFKNLREEGLR